MLNLRLYDGKGMDMSLLRRKVFIRGCMCKILKAAVLFCVLFLALPSQAKLPETRRSQNAEARYTVPLSNALDNKGASLGNSVFLRITKTQSKRDKQGKLEAFVENDKGEFIAFKSWDICTYSGELGPKLKRGDGQSPEGFYFVKPTQMNPYSSYHLSFNLGYPNTYDRVHERTGDFLMVHGACMSIGCYAVTDEGIEEIYTLLAAALKGGQPFVRVHAFPFPMTDANMKAHQGNPNITFWKNLKTGWDWFEEKSRPPNVNVVQKRYVFDETR